MKPRPKAAAGSDTSRDLERENSIWRALSDPSRRSMLDLLRRRSMTTGELSECFDFSRFAVMKHLTALEQAGLVVAERRGRKRLNHLNPVPIQAIYRRWIRPFERLGADRLLRLKATVETDAAVETTKETA